MNNRNYRCKIAAETKSYFSEIYHNCKPEITRSVTKTELYTVMTPLDDPKVRYNTKYRIMKGDTLDTAIELRKQGLKPCVLNMASDIHPGGGWSNGSLAQEECLFLRSTYDMSLSDPLGLDPLRTWKYPIPKYGGIYSPEVLVFRDNEKNDYEIWKYKDCIFLDFVAVAAIRNPRLVHGRLNDPDVKTTTIKIQTILRISALYGHTSVLLGAFGCGAFGNPPEHIAEIFKTVLLSDEFKGRFENVDFAIIDNSRTDNYRAFCKAFSSLKGEE